MGIRSIAKRVAAARASGGGNFINPGEGELMVKILKDGSRPEFNDGDTFVAELLVLSNKGYEEKDEKGQAKKVGNVVGSTISFIQQFEEFPDTAYGNTKAFLLALLGETEESLAQGAAESKAEFEKAGTLAVMCAKFDVQDWNADAEFALAYDKVTNRKENPTRGMRVRYNTYEKTSKKSGKALTLINWEHVPQNVDQIAAARAKLDAGAGNVE